MLTAKEKSLLDLLEPQAKLHNIEIVTVEIAGAKKAPTIRVYIDTPNGVSFDELSSAQIWINQIMDEVDPFPGAYTLEVSSPGIDRPLRTSEHFKRFAGERVVIQSTAAFKDRSKWTGTLLGMKNDVVEIEVDGETVGIPFDSIKKAQIRGSVDFNSRSK